MSQFCKKIKQDQDRKAMAVLYKTSLTFKVFFEKFRIGKSDPNSASNLSFTDEFRPERSSSLNIFFVQATKFTQQLTLLFQKYDARNFLGFHSKLPLLLKSQLMHYTTYTYIECKVQKKMSVEYYDLYYMRRSPLPAPGFKPTTFRLMSSCQSIPFPTGICISPFI